MTIRGGGRPRGDSSQAHPAAAEPPTAPQPRVDDRPSVAARAGGTRNAGPGSAFRYSSPAAARYANGGRRRGHGIVRFVLFAGILAILVMTALLTVLRPVLAGAVVGWAYDNPSALRLPFVADLVREDLGGALNDPPSGDATPLQFTIDPGDTPRTLAPKLKQAGLIADERAFVFIAIETNLAPKLEAGTYQVSRNMTPDQLANALVTARIVTIPVVFREGLRLEQMTAKLETVQGTGVDPTDFYDLVTSPPATLVDDYPWLKRVLPKGASLEGFLYPATYTLKPTTTADDLVRMMLTAFHDKVGDALLAKKSGGRTFYQNLVMASMVEREARFDEDRPLIAGVFANRLNPKLFPLGRLQSDVTIFYINDTLQLRSQDISQWVSYNFWAPLDGRQLPAELPADLAPYNSYTSKGLPPGPICSPSLPSIEAALAPDTKTGYLYFLSTPDGKIVYARTSAEHQQNVAKYGG